MTLIKKEVASTVNRENNNYVELFYDTDSDLLSYRGRNGATVNIASTPPTTTVVNISSTETTYDDGRPAVASGILAMGTTPIGLLPAPGANKYYDWKATIEYTHVTTPYSEPANDMMVIGGGNSYYGHYTTFWIMTGAANKANVCYPNSDILTSDGGLDYPASNGMEMNDSLVLTTLNGNSPTLGDGTMRVIITYTVRTFGA